MEPLINSWTRKSKKFKARSFQELAKLYGDSEKDMIKTVLDNSIGQTPSPSQIRLNNLTKESIFPTDNPNPQGINIKSNIT